MDDFGLEQLEHPLASSLTSRPASATVVAIWPSTKAAFSAVNSLFQGS